MTEESEWPEGLTPELAQRMVANVRSLEGLCFWLLHRFGNDSPEGNEAGFRLTEALATLAAMKPDPLVEHVADLLRASDSEGCDDEWSYELQAEDFLSELAKRGGRITFDKEPTQWMPLGLTERSWSVWQPIETAPVNVPVLVYDEGAVGVAIKLRSDWGPREYWSAKGAFSVIIHNVALKTTENPTHWMPLPEPPQ